MFNHQTIDEFLLDITETALAKADACPVVDIVETIAEKYNISTTLLCDTNHILYFDYSEQVAGFKDIHTGKIEEVMLIKNQADLDVFKKMYGIDGEIAKEY